MASKTERQNLFPQGRILAEFKEPITKQTELTECKSVEIDKVDKAGRVVFVNAKTLRSQIDPKKYSPNSDLSKEPTISKILNSTGQKKNGLDLILNDDKRLNEFHNQLLFILKNGNPFRVFPDIRDADKNLFSHVSKILKDTYKERLPLPGMDDVAQDSLILWRGLKPEELAGIIINQSAGGKKLSETQALAPTEIEAIAQVGESIKLPEFTLDIGVAEAFGQNNLVAAFKIQKKYLAKGSNAESGYVCREEAPVVLLGWRPGKNPYQDLFKTQLKTLLKGKC